MLLDVLATQACWFFSKKCFLELAKISSSLTDFFFFAKPTWPISTGYHPLNLITSSATMRGNGCHQLFTATNTFTLPLGKFGPLSFKKD